MKFSFSVGFAEVDCRTDSARVCVGILDHQGTSFGNPTSRVETNSKEGAIALRKQTFVKQQFDFLLREYFGLAVPFYLHLGKLDPIPQSVPQILHYCIGRRGFLNVVGEMPRKIRIIVDSMSDDRYRVF